jgi:serine protease Do
MKPGAIRPWKIVVGIALLLCLLAGAAYLASTFWPRVVVVEQRAVNTEHGPINPQPGIQPFDKLVDQVCPAIVSLTALAPPPDPDAKPPVASSKAAAAPPAPQPRFSGFLLSADGLIATARQNLGDAAAFQAVLQDGRRFQATIKGADDLTGLALLSLQPDDKAPPKTLPVLRFDTAAPPKVGQWALSVQSPAGAGCSASLALIASTSAVAGDRRGDALILRPELDPSAIGAPLLNVQGRVVGVAGLGAAQDAAPVGLALPSELAQDRIAAIQHGGQPPAAYGLSLGDLAPATSALFQAHKPSGSYVALVVPGSPADAAGLQVGDVVASANGRPVAHPDDVAAALQPSGSAVLNLMRAGQPLMAALSPPAPPKAAPAKRQKGKK